MLDTTNKHILDSNLRKLNWDSIIFFYVKTNCYIEHLAGIHIFHDGMKILKPKLVYNSFIIWVRKVKFVYRYNMIFVLWAYKPGIEW